MTSGATQPTKRANKSAVGRQCGFCADEPRGAVNCCDKPFCREGCYEQHTNDEHAG